MRRSLPRRDHLSSQPNQPGPLIHLRVRGTSRRPRPWEWRSIRTVESGRFDPVSPALTFFSHPSIHSLPISCPYQFRRAIHSFIIHCTDEQIRGLERDHDRGFSVWICGECQSRAGRTDGFQGTSEILRLGMRRKKNRRLARTGWRPRKARALCLSACLLLAGEMQTRRVKRVMEGGERARGWIMGFRRGGEGGESLVLRGAAEGWGSEDWCREFEGAQTWLRWDRREEAAPRQEGGDCEVENEDLRILWIELKKKSDAEELKLLNVITAGFREGENPHGKSGCCLLLMQFP